jgi:hypothetical protein
MLFDGFFIFPNALTLLICEAPGTIPTVYSVEDMRQLTKTEEKGE